MRKKQREKYELHNKDKADLEPLDEVTTSPGHASVNGANYGSITSLLNNEVN